MAAALPTVTREYYFPKLGSYENLKVKESPIPKLKPTEVLLKVHAVSLQYRDLGVSRGTYPTYGPENLVPCSDMAGEVLAVGEDVSQWKIGDRVCPNFALDHLDGEITLDIQATILGGPVHGVLTEYKIVPAHSLVAIPSHYSYEEGSTLPCAALTAYNALLGRVPALKAGEYVLVLGTGGVSIWALQFAIASGAVGIVTSSSDDKLEIAKKLGAQHTINYKKIPNWHEEVLKITNGVGVDHVIEVGGVGTLEKSMQASRIGGSIHIIGSVSQDQGVLSSTRPIIRKNLKILGVLVGPVAQFRNMVRLISANVDTTRPVIDTVFPFEDAVKAYAYLESQAHVGKVVIKVSKD